MFLSQVTVSFRNAADGKPIHDITCNVATKTKDKLEIVAAAMKASEDADVVPKGVESIRDAKIIKTVNAKNTEAIARLIGDDESLTGADIDLLVRDTFEDVMTDAAEISDDKVSLDILRSLVGDGYVKLVAEHLNEVR